MDAQVLVTYSIKRGATAEFAKKIGEVLRQAGIAADVLPVDQVADLSPYGAVVLGSAVHVGQWRKEAVRFLQAKEGRLAQLAVWLFSTGPTGTGDPGATYVSRIMCKPCPANVPLNSQTTRRSGPGMCRKRKKRCRSGF